MNEIELMILQAAFADELEKIAKTRLQMMQEAGGPGAFLQGLRNRRAISRMPRSRSAQVGRGATGEIDMSPNFMTPRERSQRRNIAGQTVAAPAPVMRGGVLHYSS